MMTRFFAHLCLFLQMIDIPVPPLATQVILEAYLQVLEVTKLRFIFSGSHLNSEILGCRSKESDSDVCRCIRRQCS